MKHKGDSDANLELQKIKMFIEHQSLVWIYLKKLIKISEMLYVQSIGCAFVSVIGEVKVIKKSQESDLEHYYKALNMEGLNCLRPDFVDLPGQRSVKKSLHRTNTEYIKNLFSKGSPK